MINSVVVSGISLISIFFGKYRERFRKMTCLWWLIIYASIPFIIPLQIGLTIPLFIGMAVMGQFVGSRLEVKKEN